LRLHVRAKRWLETHPVEATVVLVPGVLTVIIVTLLVIGGYIGMR